MAITAYNLSNSYIFVKLLYLGGHKEDVTLSANYTYSSPGIANVSNGSILGLALDKTQIPVTYAGLMGEPATATLSVAVTLRNPYIVTKV